MNKLFYIIEAVLVCTVIVLLHYSFIGTIINFGGIADYFAKNMFALYAFFLLSFLDLFILFPAAFCFIAMSFGKTSDFCFDVIFYPFSLFEKD